MKKFTNICLAVCCFSLAVFAQIPTAILVNIVKAEDERRYDKTLEDLLKNRDEKIRIRAALAAGRIGESRAVAPLINLLETDASSEVRTMAAFALGEIESLQGADAIIKILADTKNDGQLRARAVEAAGKIATANAKDEQSKLLGEAILDALEYENTRRSRPNTEAILFGLTAVLRVRPEDGDFVAAKFLNYLDAGIRADAANTLSRLRAKNANPQLRAMLLSDDDANVRANAARALGAAEDAAAFDLLLEAALTDEDSRVRVSAIRSLGSLKDKRAADKLTERGENLLKAYKKEFYAVAPFEKNELLEIATTLGKILPNSDNEKALGLLNRFGVKDSYNSSEIHIAVAKISPSTFLKIEVPEFICSVNYARIRPSCWRFYSGRAQGFGELASLEANNSLRDKAASILRKELKSYKKYEFATDRITEAAVSDTLTAFSSFKTDDLPNVLRDFSKYNVIFARATAAELLGEQLASKENVEALKTAFAQALEKDIEADDAQLAILAALVKLDKTQAATSLKLALDAPNYVVRRRAADLIRQNDLAKDFPNAEEKVGTVKIHNPNTRTKLGQVLNTNADHVRAVSRKGARAILTTEKGSFTIEFAPQDAPLTVDNFINLAKKNYFNGLAIHRVVPNFVMQDGDPRGDGNGSPGYSIRCEINMLPFERGAVGMALSGKDTGGSQWFVTHSPQPHLDGGYTIFGRVNETDMKIVDTLVRGDVILTVKIVEGNAAPKITKSRRK